MGQRGRGEGENTSVLDEKGRRGRERQRRGRVKRMRMSEHRANMKQSLHWKVKNLSSPSAFDLPLGASVLIVPGRSSGALPPRRSRRRRRRRRRPGLYLLQHSLQRVSGEVYRPPSLLPTVCPHMPCASAYRRASLFPMPFPQTPQ